MATGVKTADSSAGCGSSGGGGGSGTSSGGAGSATVDVSAGATTGMGGNKVIIDDRLLLAMMHL